MANSGKKIEGKRKAKDKSTISKFMGINRKINSCSNKKWKGKSSHKQHCRSNKIDLGTDNFDNPLDEKVGTSGDLSLIRKRKLFFSELGIIDDSDDDTDNSENDS